MINIVLETCTLRDLLPEDAPSIAFHANDFLVSLYLRPVFPFPYLLKDAEDFIHHVSFADSDKVFAIIVNGAAVGCAGLHSFDIENGRTVYELGYWLGRIFWRRGIATEVVRCLTHYSFTELNAAKVVASVYSHNAASVKVLERCGFERVSVQSGIRLRDNSETEEWFYIFFRSL